MPELPEVEVTRIGIAPHVEGKILREMRLRETRLREVVDSCLPALLKNARITLTERRGKYIAIHCQCANGKYGTLLIHLGMSGSLCVVSADTPLRKHDHIDWVFDGAVVRYHDPRRFGAVLWHPAENGDWREHRRLRELGLEPFDVRFNADYVYQVTRVIRSDIKVSLLAGKWVVGVGNIYASEVLFLCRIHPQTPTHQLTRAQCRDLAQHIPQLLQSAIDQGGSTLKDFIHGDGASGYFQMFFHVYDRAGEPCTRCATPIERLVQAQRASYFCPKCQKLKRQSVKK